MNHLYMQGRFPSGSFLSVLVYQPLLCVLLPEHQPTIPVVDPVLVGHLWKNRFDLAIGFIDLPVLSSELDDPVPNGLAGVSIGTIGVHRVERDTFEMYPDKLADSGFARRRLAVALTQIDCHLQSGLG